MLKKIFISVLLIISFFTFSYHLSAYSVGDSDKLNSPNFKIDVSNFSPGGGEILDEAREGGGNTAKTANIILSKFIKNLIVVFGVLSLLMMTIGGGMMIFHSGQESILTKGKSIFMYGIISLVVGLSAGIIVQLVSYFLY